MHLATLFIIACTAAMIQNTPVDKCEMCVKVLKCLYGHFGKNIKSRRQLDNKLEGTCKRYPHYKQRCLRFTKVNLLKIFDDLQPERYDPEKTCTDVQECVQAPIIPHANISYSNHP